MLLQKCYEFLEIPMNSSEIQIKRAYRHKAKLLHPDANNHEDAKLQFQILNEAYHFILLSLKQKPVDEDVDDEKDNYKKYGTSARNKTYSSKYRKNDIHINIEKEETLNRSPYDKLIYWFFIALGVNLLVFGILDIVKHKEGETLNFGGLFAAIPFLVILIYGWRYIKNI